MWVCTQIVYAGRQSARQPRQCEHTHTYICVAVILDVYLVKTLERQSNHERNTSTQKTPSFGKQKVVTNICTYVCIYTHMFWLLIVAVF